MPFKLEKERVTFTYWTVSALLGATSENNTAHLEPLETQMSLLQITY